MYFAIGFCGALACLGMFALGAAVGWNAYRLTHNGAAPKSLRKSVRDERDAFSRLQSYGVEDAYGLTQEQGRDGV